MAVDRSSAVAVGALAFLSAVRSAERCARLRTVAARDFRMFFFADAIFGTKKTLRKIRKDSRSSQTPNLPARASEVKLGQHFGSVAIDWHGYQNRGRVGLTNSLQPRLDAERARSVKRGASLLAHALGEAWREPARARAYSPRTPRRC